MTLEWINCLTGFSGSIDVFPAEMLSEGRSPGVSFKVVRGVGVKIVPDFRAEGIFLNGKTLLGASLLEIGAPAVLRMGRTLLVLCVTSPKSENDWADAYRFPLWTIFDSGTFEAIETVRSPGELSSAAAQNGLSYDECLVSPYGLPVCIPLSHIGDLLLI